MAICVVAALIVIVAAVIYIYRESTEFHVVEYEFSDKRLLKDETRFVFLSDMHNRQYGEDNSRLYESVKDINPDFIILGGDMITSCMEKWAGYYDTLEFIGRLAALYPVYYCIGNHEERLMRRPEKFPPGIFEKLLSDLKKAGTPLLIDECVTLDEYGIKLYSLNVDHLYYRKVITRHLPDDYINGKIGTPDENFYNILASHNPEHFVSYVKWGGQLVLSGHVHGGIVRLPFLGGVVSPALKLFPKYDGGLFTDGNTAMVLSRGIGSHTVPIRINNKAELIVVKLIKEK